MRNMIVVKGTSGVGKGTRVVQFIEWLRTKFEPVDITYSMDDKVKPFGIAFKELGLLFVGGYTTSNKSGLASWSSMDMIHASTGSGEAAREFLKQFMDDGYSLVCEGEPLMLSDKWRPKFMQDYYGLDSMAIMYLNYTDRARYDERIIGRSGKKAGDSAWSRNESYSTEFEKSKQEMLDIGYQVWVDYSSGQDVLYTKPDTNTQEMRTQYVSSITKLPFDAPLRIVGNTINNVMIQDGGYARAMNMAFGEGHIEQFFKFCEEHPMKRSVGHRNPLAHRIPQKPSKTSKAKVVTTPAPTSKNLLDIMRGGK